MLNQPPASSFLSPQPMPYGQQNTSPWAFSPQTQAMPQQAQAPTLVQDPTTGLVLDTATGVAYDPTTGQAIDPENPIIRQAELGVMRQEIATQEALLAQQAAMQQQEAGNVLNDNANQATALLSQPGLPQALTQQLALELESLKGTQSQNEAKAGLFGGMWDGLISAVGADGDDPRWYDPRHLLGLQKDKGSGAVQDNLLKHQQALLTMQNISPLVGTDPQATAHFAALYQEVTGRPLNAAELESNLPTGLLAQSKAAQKVDGYQANQKLGQDLIKDTLTGFAALGAIALAPVSGGLSLGALGVAVGAGVVAKPTLSAINELTASDGEFEVNLGKDMLTGAVAGGTAILGEGVGNWAGQNLAKTLKIGTTTAVHGATFGTTSIAQKASTKVFGNALTSGYTITGNNLAKNALIRGTSIAVSGGLDGGVSGGVSTLAEGGSLSDALRNAALGATVGIGFRGAGDLASRSLNATVFANKALASAEVNAPSPMVSVAEAPNTGGSTAPLALSPSLAPSQRVIITPPPETLPVNLAGDGTSTIEASAVAVQPETGGAIVPAPPTHHPKGESIHRSTSPLTLAHGVAVTPANLKANLSTRTVRLVNQASPEALNPTGLKADLQALLHKTDITPARQQRIQNVMALLEQQDDLKANMAKTLDPASLPKANPDTLPDPWAESPLGILDNSFNEVRTRTTKKGGAEALPPATQPLEAKYGHQAPQSLQAEQTLAFLREEVRELLPEKPQHVQALAQHHQTLGFNLSQTDARLMLRDMMTEFKASNPNTPLNPWDVMGMMAEVDPHGLVFANELQELGQQFAGATRNGQFKGMLNRVAEQPKPIVQGLRRPDGSPSLLPPDNQGLLAWNPLAGDKVKGQQTDFIPYGRATQQAEALLAQKGKVPASDTVIGILKDMDALNKGEVLTAIVPASPMVSLTPSQQGLLANLADTDPSHPLVVAHKNGRVDMANLEQLTYEIESHLALPRDYSANHTRAELQSVNDAALTGIMTLRNAGALLNDAASLPIKNKAGNLVPAKGGGVITQTNPTNLNHLTQTEKQFVQGMSNYLHQGKSHVEAAQLALTDTMATLTPKAERALAPRRGQAPEVADTVQYHRSMPDTLDALAETGRQAIAEAEPIRLGGLPEEIAPHILGAIHDVDVNHPYSLEGSLREIGSSPELSPKERQGLVENIVREAKSRGMDIDYDPMAYLTGTNTPAALPAGVAASATMAEAPPPPTAEPVVPPPPIPEAEAVAPSPPPPVAEPEPVAPPKADAPKPITSLERQAPNLEGLSLEDQIKLVVQDLNNAYEFYGGTDLRARRSDNRIMNRKQGALLNQSKQFVAAEALRLARLGYDVDDIMPTVLKRLEKNAQGYHNWFSDAPAIFANIPKKEADQMIKDFRKVFTYQQPKA